MRSFCPAKSAVTYCVVPKLVSTEHDDVKRAIAKFREVPRARRCEQERAGYT